MNWADADLKSLPPRTSAQLLAYVEHGRLPGAMLTAILSNDLRESVKLAREAAGSDAYALLDAVLRVLERDGPGAAFGSPEKVHDWTRRGGLNGTPTTRNFGGNS